MKSLAVAASFTLSGLVPLFAQDPPPSSREHWQPCIAVAQRVFPAVVTVQSLVRVADDATAQPGADGTRGWVVSGSGERDYPGFRVHRSGSGFFVGATGCVLTALQPLQREDGKLADLFEIETTSGQRAIAEVVGIEPTLQLAVLRGAVFESVEPAAVAGLTFGDSEALELGSFVCGVGDPLGPERYLGLGVLVAKPSRDCYQELLSATYMQATLSVPPGAVGGPLVDLDGNVVGMLSRLQLEGIGDVASPGSAWALPSKILSGLFESIRTAGTTQSPWLGFSVTSRAELAAERGFQAFQKLVKPKHGIMLENVFAPSPAAAAGLQPGDWLTHFDGVEIHVPVGFQKQLYLAGVGRKVTLTLFRDGETLTREIEIAPRPPEAAPR